MNFDKDFSKEHKIVRNLFWFQVIGFVTIALFFVIVRDTLPTILLILSLLVIAITVVAGFYYIWSYKKTPQIKQKDKLSSKLSKNSKNQSDANKNIKQAKEKRETINTKEKVAIEQRTEKYQQTIFSIKSRNQRYTLEELNELGKELSKLQGSHIEYGINTSSILHAKIPGIGRKLKQRLVSSGISSAKHVSLEGVMGVSGFGIEKAEKVVSWQSAVKRHLKNTKPSQLPADIKNQVSSRFQEFHEAANQKASDEEKSLKIVISAIQAKAKNMHEINNDKERKAGDNLTNLQFEENDIRGQLNEYKSITFWKYLERIFTNEPIKLIGVQIPDELILVIIFLGLIFQSVVSASATTRLFIASL